MSAKETVGKTFAVAGILCIACSILVSVAAVQLRPIQNTNKALDKKKNILAAAGLLEEGSDIEQVFAERIKARLIDLDTGEYNDSIDASTYDQRKAAKDPERSIVIDPKIDLPKIRRRAKIAMVYEVIENDRLAQVILPVHGKGLWSTLYGFLAVKADANTIVGLGFYEHAETPGLGGEVDNPKWKAQWQGKKLFADDGSLKIKVLKGQTNPNSSDIIYQLDGLSGATLTTNGVNFLLQYWLSDQGFGQYISKIKERGSTNG